jgi:protein-S-isoprenylcysteine O-methyltransferase Ste14
MSEGIPAYGLWALVVVNSAIFIIFGLSFFRPGTKRDRRSFGAFSAFIVALVAEMYGCPLTICLLSGWLQERFPQLDPFSHEAGHLWHSLLGLKGDPHFNPMHILSNVFIIAGFFVISSAWRVLYKAKRERALAVTGPYGLVRHPQYDGFILIMLGFLLQWPTLLTLLMFPVLVFMYVRLARKEEQEVRAEFGEAYEDYARRTPGLIPSVRELG